MSSGPEPPKGWLHGAGAALAPGLIIVAGVTCLGFAAYAMAVLKTGPVAPSLVLMGVALFVIAAFFPRLTGQLRFGPRGLELSLKDSLPQSAPKQSTIQDETVAQQARSDIVPTFELDMHGRFTSAPGGIEVIVMEIELRIDEGATPLYRIQSQGLEFVQKRIAELRQVHLLTSGETDEYRTLLLNLEALKRSLALFDRALMIVVTAKKLGRLRTAGQSFNPQLTATNLAECILGLREALFWQRRLDETWWAWRKNGMQLDVTFVLTSSEVDQLQTDSYNEPGFDQKGIRTSRG